MLRNGSVKEGIWRGAMVALALSIGVTAQALETEAQLEWAKQLGSVVRDTDQAIASLPDGSFLAMGYFESDFGVPGVTVPTVGCGDVFVAKFNSSGTVQWVNSLGSGHCDYAGDICTLPDGTRAIKFTYGYGGAECIVGLGQSHFTWLLPFDYYDIGIAKYAANGDFLWARRAGRHILGRRPSRGSRAGGSLYVTGSYGTYCALGDDDDISGNDVHFTDGYGFIARYNTNGGLAWAENEYGCGPIAALWDGSCIFSGTTNTDTGVIPAGLIRYGADGTELWSTGPSDEHVVALCALPSGREFVAAGGKSATAFVRKYRVESDDSVTVVCEKSLSDTHLSWPRLDVAPDGDCYLLEAITCTLYHFECNGHLFFQETLEASPQDVCASQVDNTCFVASAYDFDVTFGQGQANETSFTAMDCGDIYLARYEAGQRHQLCSDAQGLGCVFLDPPGGCYGEGTEVTVRAVPYFDDHDEFDHWEGDLAGEPSTLTVTVGSGGLSSTAVFVELPDAPPLPALSLLGLAGLAGTMAAVAWRRSRKR